ncbi:bifunctional diguanylate cyclase/phosphodiesterase [Chitinimonas koreensis]|uniref:bifunctional diguanylate cyclase/phosphodiesterase n=1 Tax=Chitinimonas koreensis TaxID=356302 RepID=UPI0003F889A9|nr:EAL domain-containing protein [Chitinimonas koreensis]QNM98533.1 EAL domain-containing protein [Chitinimonas koreensis]
MSLLRQLWLIVLLSTLLAFVGGFVVNLTTARQYLEQQLMAQSADNAASLALSMSQQSKDPATVELMVSALFDSGHFRVIRYLDVHGKVAVERINDSRPERVPDWFMKLVPLRVERGTGMVSNGWSQAGRVEVVAHERFAYQSLWDGALTFLAVMALTGLLSGIAVTALIRWVRQPLRELVRQAEAIGERHFITIREPNVTELRLVVRTMNAMVDRVKSMFAEQAARIDELRASANRDGLTGLPNRDNFLGRLRQALTDENAAPNGSVLLVRLHDLAGINRSRGRAGTDEYLRGVGAALARCSASQGDSLLARLNGADFVLLLPGASREETEAIGRACLQALGELGVAADQQHGTAAHAGAAFYRAGMGEGSLLSAADQALARAEADSGNALALAEQEGAAADTVAAWREELEQALAGRAFEMASFPVLDQDSALLHHEVLLRLRRPDGELVTAGKFMPMAARFGLLAQLDLIAVELAAERLQRETGEIAVNLSAASIADAGFIASMRSLLERYRAVAGRLWFEVNEYGLGGDYEKLAEFASAARGFGCKIGIEHFGRQFGRIPALYDLRLDYLKIDGSFIRDIDSQPGNQQLVKAIIGVSGGAGLRVLAEAVHGEAEWQCLKQLGVHGITGPLATQLYRA